MASVESYRSSHLEQRAVAVLLADDCHWATQPELLPAVMAEQQTVAAEVLCGHHAAIIKGMSGVMVIAPRGGPEGSHLSSRYQAASAHGSLRTSRTLPVLHGAATAHPCVIARAV